MTVCPKCFDTVGLLLKSHNANAALINGLEEATARIAKLEAVAKAARDYLDGDLTRGGLTEALAWLDGEGGR